MTTNQQRAIRAILKLRDAVAAVRLICVMHGGKYSNLTHDFHVAADGVEWKCDRGWVYQKGEGNCVSLLRQLGLYDNSRQVLGDVRVRPRRPTNVKGRNNRT